MKLYRILPVLLIVFALAGYSFAATSYPPLTALPLGDRWFSISLNDERTGFIHQTIEPHADGYRLTTDSSVKMTVLGFSREAAVRESYLIRHDLSLASLTVEMTLDGSRMKLTGKAVPEGISLTVETAGTAKTRIMKVKGPVYPGPTLNFYPLFKGFIPGKKYHIKFFDAEAQKISEVTVTAVGVEGKPGPEVRFHLRNDLYPMVDNDIWVDRQGNTLKESVRDGLIVTKAEEPDTAARLLVENVLARKDMVFDFSLVPVAPPINEPERLKRLVVALAGWPEDLALPEDSRQKVQERVGQSLTIALTHTPLSGTGASLPDPERLQALEVTERIIPDNPEIRHIAATIAGQEKDPAVVVGLLVGWVTTNVEGTVTDNISPLETLKTRKGNCQAHARLYVSLARAVEIPTRFVSGLVYQQGKGFLYHSWAESFVGGEWLPVDPTFGQVPADLTHIRMFIGDRSADVAPLARFIGRLKATILDQEYEAPPSN